MANIRKEDTQTLEKAKADFIKRIADILTGDTQMQFDALAMLQQNDMYHEYV